MASGFLPHQVLSEQGGGASQDVPGGFFRVVSGFFGIQKIISQQQNLGENSELGSPGKRRVVSSSWESLGLDLG